MSDPTRFRLASLNLLATHVEQMNERLDLVVEELRQLRPDALCLQEVVDGCPYDIPRRIAEALGWDGVFSGDTAPAMLGGLAYGNAVIAQSTFDTAVSLDRVTASLREVPAVSAGLTHHGRRIQLISAHLAWGGDGEPSRQRQALTLDAHARATVAQTPGTTVLLAGDFNAIPATDTNRFFDGSTVLDGRSTLWVDAWENAGDSSNEMTTRNDNDYAFATARSVGIDHPRMVPSRRIDYLKAFGWTYGRSGHPLAFGRWADSETAAGLSISDHYGIIGDFLLV
jgi:endonuclease/exonuclease/phosphatase family metal-dependent hydrolase